MTVVSVHLPLDADQRVDHASTVLRAIIEEVSTAFPADPEEGGIAAPVVVGGDINEDSTGRAWGVLAGQLTEVTDQRPTFPAARPKAPIDGIFATGHRSAAPGTVEALDEELDPETFRAASDHLPVWVDLQF